MKSLVISTAIILAIGLGGSFVYQALVEPPRGNADAVHRATGNVPVRWDCGGVARVVLVQS